MILGGVWERSFDKWARSALQSYYISGATHHGLFLTYQLNLPQTNCQRKLETMQMSLHVDVDGVISPHYLSNDWCQGMSVCHTVTFSLKVDFVGL